MNETFSIRQRLAILVVWTVAILLYFHAKAPVSMQADWTHDDLMNAYRAFETPWSTMFRDIVLFWTPTNLYRPIGELLYKIGYDYSGFHIWPWRFVISGILILNAFILGHVAARMSGSLGYGLAVTAVASFHPFWAHLYLNTGVIFEILSFTFVYTGLACYVEFRDKPWVLPATALIFILGLNSKESAIVLPVYLVLYDIVFRRRIDWKVFVVFGAISLAFIFGRVYGANGLTTIGMYKPVYSLATYLDRFRGYFGPLILWTEVPLNAAMAIAILPLVCANRMAVFATLVFPLGILPLAFVPDRGLEGVYVACAGLALSLPCVLLLIPKDRWRLLGAVLIFAALWKWLPAQRGLNGAEREYGNIRNFHEGMLAAAPTLPSHIQIRLLKEPFLEDETWASTFATRLLYRDLTIDVVAPFNPHTKDWPVDRDYAVFEWRDNKMIRLK